MANAPLFRSTMLALVMFGASAAIAKPASAVAPAVLQNVINCRAIVDDKARLRCFDDGVAQLDTANSHGDIAVFDKDAVVRTRRALFGFTMPSLDIFSHRTGDAARDAQDSEMQEITAKIGAAAQGAEGWVFTLDDGARWAQSDDVVLGRAPKAGMTVVIRRGPLGSFKMRVANGPSIKVRRVS